MAFCLSPSLSTFDHYILKKLSPNSMHKSSSSLGGKTTHRNLTWKLKKGETTILIYNKKVAEDYVAPGKEHVSVTYNCNSYG